MHTNKKRVRMLSLVMALVLLFSATAAVADTISSSSPVKIYNSRTESSPFMMGSIAKQESTNEGGWYKVNETGGYVRAADVTRHDTATPTPTASASPSPTPSLAPGETPKPTASPTPGPVIAPETDTSYEGQIISYKVLAGGLWLYDKIDGTAVLNIAAGTTINLNKKSDTDTWYSTYYNGKTYYVPQSLTNYSPTETIKPTDIKSITLSVNVNLFTSYNSSTHVLSGSTSHVLSAGTRINVTHVQTYTENGNSYDIYSHEIEGKKYYFNGSGMEKSSATVVGSDNAALVLYLKVDAEVRLYRSKDKSAKDFLKLPGTAGLDSYTLLGQKVDSDWYRVEYASELFYLSAGDLSGVQEVVSSGDGAKENTFQVTAGVEGAQLYTSRTMSGSTPAASARSGKTIAPGQSVLAGPYDTNWYTYVVKENNVETLYYLFAKEFASSTSTEKISSIKIFLDEQTGLFDTMKATRPVSITLAAGYYTVQVVDNTWYSIVYDGQTYYIKKDTNAASKVVLTLIESVHGTAILPSNPLAASATVQVQAYVLSGNYIFTYGGAEYQLPVAVYTDPPDSTQTSIATTGENKSYYVVIGMTGATLYYDAACQSPSPNRLLAGELVKATKYTSSLYIVEQSGAKLYLPVTYITSVKDGDDASVVNAGRTEESVSSVIVGEVDNNYQNEVISYKVPKGGLWLYRDPGNLATATLSLNEGAVITLNGNVPSYPNVYTTWYGGQQYYVPRSALVVAADATNTTDTYSVKLTTGVQLYTNNTLATLSSPTISLSANSWVNVKVARKNTNGTIASYAYTHSDGKTYYFNGNAVAASDILGATLASNGDTSLITKIVLNANMWAYSSPSTTSSSVQIKANETVYGVKYDSSWYKIIYDDSVWYLKNDSSKFASCDQITVTNNVGATTYTVVIGVEGAKLYTKPTTNTSQTTVNGIAYAAGMLNYANDTLAAGSVVQACKYDATWYSIARSGVTLYFQTNKTTNASSNESIQSYRIAITSGQIGALPASSRIMIGTTDGIRLYTTISDTATHIRSVNLGPGTYTMRKVNSVWSQVVIKNVTYYVKNADLPTTAAEESTPIASTTVGKSYKITIGPNGSGTPASIYASDKLTGTPYATNVAGHQTTGLKLHVVGAQTSNGDELVFKITYGGRTGYVSAEFVTGVAEGDEVEEARLRAEQEANENNTSTTPVGQKNTYSFTANTKLYSAQSTSGSFLLLPAQTTLEATKVSADWYSVTYNGQTYYIHRSVIEPDAGSGQTGDRVILDVGDSYSYTLTMNTLVYGSTESGAPVMDVAMAGGTYTLKKISEDWYEINYQGKTAYIKVSEILLPRVPSGGTATLIPPGGTTTTDLTDGTGYITPLLTISPTSGTVNLRKTATTGGTILDRIPKGTQVVNNSYTKDASGQIWYSVTYNGRTGYVRGDLVSPVGTTTSGSTGASAADDIGKAFLVNAASVNVRSGAGANYSIIGQVAKNTTVVPLDYTVGTDTFTWYKFQFSSSKTGYIRSDFLAGSAVNTTQQSGNVAIKAGGTNMRSGPGDSFSVVTKLDRDVIATILGTSTDSKDVMWYRITVDGLSGYVRSDLVRPLTAAEQGGLQNDLVSQYTELKSGSKGAEVTALQQQLINLGYLAAGGADGNYGPKTVAAVKAFQTAKSLTANGVASPGTQAVLFNTINIQSGTTSSLDWFSIGQSLINANKNIQIFDITSQVTWNALYINGASHADVVPASKADADKLRANSITGSYVRRPIIVTIAGQKYAGSMYAVGHGTQSYVSYFSGVMCIHFTGSKTHGSDNVDTDHQNAIQQALNYANGA